MGTLSSIKTKGQESEALHLVKSSQATCLKLDACEKFEIFQWEGNIHHFTFVELWRSNEDQKAWFDVFINKPETLEALKVFSQPSEVEYFNLK